MDSSQLLPPYVVMRLRSPAQHIRNVIQDENHDVYTYRYITICTALPIKMFIENVEKNFTKKIVSEKP